MSGARSRAESKSTAVSPKLLGLLGVSIVLALVGAWRLLSTETTTDVGFEGVESLPVDVSGPTPDLDAVVDVPLGRNPFERTDQLVRDDATTDSAAEGGDPDAVPTGDGVTQVEITPATGEIDNDVGDGGNDGSANDEVVQATEPPAFPLPDLADQGPPDRSSRDDEFTG